MKKIFCIVISIITAIGGYIGLIYCIVQWNVYGNEQYIGPIIIFGIITTGGFFSAIITTIYYKKTKYIPHQKIKYQYKSTKSNEKQIEDENENHGERLVKILMGRTVEGEQYVVNNLIISNEDKTKSSQIDHVFINQYGIWCIETKDWGGMIFGKETDEQWTQVFRYGKEKYKHYNPIKQNETHVYHLKKALKYNKEIHNIIIFTNGDITNVNAKNVYDVERLQYLLWKSKSKIELTKEEMEIYYNQLLKIKTTQISDEQHVINVNSRIA